MKGEIIISYKDRKRYSSAARTTIFFNNQPSPRIQETKNSLQGEMGMSLSYIGGWKKVCNPKSEKLSQAPEEPS